MEHNPFGQQHQVQQPQEWWQELRFWRDHQHENIHFVGKLAILDQSTAFQPELSGFTPPTILLWGKRNEDGSPTTILATHHPDPTNSDRMIVLEDVGSNGENQNVLADLYRASKERFIAERNMQRQNMMSLQPTAPIASMAGSMPIPSSSSRRPRKRQRGGEILEPSGFQFPFPASSGGSIENFLSRGGLPKQTLDNLMARMLRFLFWRSYLNLASTSRFWKNFCHGAACDEEIWRIARIVHRERPQLYNHIVNAKDTFYNLHVLDVAFDTRCSGSPTCSNSATRIYLPFMERVCEPCLLTNSRFRTIVKSAATTMFSLSERQIKQLPMISYDSSNRMIIKMYLFAFKTVEKHALKIHGSRDAMKKAVQDADQKRMEQHRTNLEKKKQEHARDDSKSVRARPPRLSHQLAAYKDDEYRRGASIVCTPIPRQTLINPLAGYPELGRLAMIPGGDNLMEGSLMEGINEVTNPQQHHNHHQGHYNHQNQSQHYNQDFGFQNQEQYHPQTPRYTPNPFMQEVHANCSVSMQNNNFPMDANFHLALPNFSENVSLQGRQQVFQPGDFHRDQQSFLDGVSPDGRQPMFRDGGFQQAQSGFHESMFPQDQSPFQGDSAFQDGFFPQQGEPVPKMEPTNSA